jgi:hypothetical protein
MTPADGSPSRPAHFPGFVPLAAQGRDARQRRAHDADRPPPPESAKTGRRRVTARYDGALTPASHSTAKDFSSLTVLVHRLTRMPRPRRAARSKPSSAQKWHGAPGTIPAGIGDRPSPAPAWRARHAPAPVELLQASDQALARGFKTSSPASSCARSLARAGRSVRPTPRSRPASPSPPARTGIATQLRGPGLVRRSARYAPKTADQRPECAPERRVS